jgi:putative ABC transport system substrate-binding protein
MEIAMSTENRSQCVGKTCLLLLLFMFYSFLQTAVVQAGETVHIGILSANQTRNDTINGFEAGMAGHAGNSGAAYLYKRYEAEGDRSKLAGLAAELIAEKPDLAIAAGGIEADALKLAAKGTGIPVVFLAVSSAVDRGLVANMRTPGGSLTGVDTNDTALVEKRLWYIQKLLPTAKRVLCFHIPGITPSTASIELARKVAPQLGLELQVLEVANKEAVAAAAATIKRANTDVILLLPVAPIDAMVNSVLLPLSRQERIPIMGNNQQSIERGAFAAYGSSRYRCGEQAARLAIKILNGASPATLPAETPSTLELILNRHLVGELDLKLSKRSWRMADKVVDLKLKPE